MKSSSEAAPVPSPAPSNKAYPWLLGVSTCLSGVLCWLYVTKPVQIVPERENGATTEELEVSIPKSEPQRAKVATAPESVDLVPSDNALPGTTPLKQDVASKLPKPVDPRQIIESGNGSGWETTNSRVQHILSADAGDGDVTKIVLNVPVLYQTRTMRWTPTDVQKARDILTRLMVYENNLSKLKQEGESLLIHWNQLLEKTVPAPALRADSPSLPYNHSLQPGDNGYQESGSTIKVER